MFRSYLATALLMSSVGAFAVSPAEDLSKQLGNAKSFSSQFVQTVASEGQAKSDKSSGTFELQHPGKFRWEVAKPYNQILISTGKTLWIYEPDIDSVTVNDLEQEIGSTPALLLSSDRETLLSSFNVAINAKSEYVLTPKNAGANFEQIRLRFANGALAELNLNDTLGSVTQVLFTNVKMNPSIDAARFEFTPPASADVIDNRRHVE